MCNHLQLSQPCECLLFFFIECQFYGTGTLSMRFPNQCTYQKMAGNFTGRGDDPFNTVQQEIPGKSHQVSGFLSLLPLVLG